jgi:DNA-binding NarL/FixJ family response regulator
MLLERIDIDAGGPGALPEGLPRPNRVMVHSAPFARAVADVAEFGVAEIDDGGGEFVCTTAAISSQQPAAAVPGRLALGLARPCSMVAVSPIPLRREEIGRLSQLETSLQSAEDGGAPGVWAGFACESDGGEVDRVYLRLRAAATSDPRAILRAVWPFLRNAWIAEATDAQAAEGDQALLWTARHIVDPALLVLDEHARLLRVNRSGDALLAAGTPLRLVRGAVTTADCERARFLREAIQACARGTAQRDNDELLLLPGGPEGQALPLSLTRYGTGTAAGPGLVVLLAPRSPDPMRIRRIGAKLGLSATEARVAALLHMGLANREAAELAGLKEQTFATYTKRVLSKLNLRCRAELAHLLTWQAMGRRA